jgi:hypothetical protein
LEGCRGKSEFRNPNTCGEQSEIRIVGDNIEAPGEGPEAWMLELARMLILKDLPTGVIVGSAVIDRRRNGDGIRFAVPSPVNSENGLRPRSIRRFNPYLPILAPP